MIREKRKTRESIVSVRIDEGDRREFEIDTGLQFLNHMIETIAWRACMNVDVKVEMTNFKLEHVIAKDAGIVLGKCLNKMLKRKMKKGVKGSGYAVSVIDEAMAVAAVSMEGRTNSFVDLRGKKAFVRNVEDMKGCDLQNFIEGMAQGMQATIQVKVLAGYDPHHIWEAVFRALGEGLRDCYSDTPWRKDTIAGVKGILK